MNKDISRRQVLQGLGAFIVSGALASTFTTSIAAPLNDPLQPFYVTPPAKLSLDGKGINMRTLIRNTQTNKQYSCVEFLIAPKQMGPPPHVHKDLDEIMYVLEGTVTVMVENKTYEVKAGSWHLRPHGMTHTFWNGTKKPARYIDMYFNQDFEDFLEELNFKLLPYMEEHKLSPQDPKLAAWWADLDQRFGITTFFEKRQGIIDRYKLKP